MNEAVITGLGARIQGAGKFQAKGLAAPEVQYWTYAAE